MTEEQTKLLAQIDTRSDQATRKNELMDWHSLADWLFDLADTWATNDHKFSLVLRSRAELAYQHSLNLLPVDREVPYLICGAVG